MEFDSEQDKENIFTIVSNFRDFPGRDAAAVAELLATIEKGKVEPVVEGTDG